VIERLFTEVVDDCGDVEAVVRQGFVELSDSLPIRHRVETHTSLTEITVEHHFRNISYNIYLTYTLFMLKFI